MPLNLTRAGGGARRAVVESGRFDAVLFDLDGVLTSTATLHAAAWKQTFDEFVDAWDHARGTRTPRFGIADDYPRLVDGKPRLDGVRAFLHSRGIELPDGTSDAPIGEWSVQGLGNRKQELVDTALRVEGVSAYPGSVAWLREMRDTRLATAVVTSSSNAATVLEAAGLLDLFDARVDGATLDELGLAGKPAPDAFLEAARRLDVHPARAVVVEDAQVGVAAGRAGGFGLVIGVDRSGQADALRTAGADLVVADLAELLTCDAAAPHPAGPKEHRLRAGGARVLASAGDFPIDGHRIVERRFDPDHVPQLESIFALTNGYLGLRGVHDEGRPARAPAASLNGFYETWPIVYPEGAYGLAETGQTIVGVPDGSVIRLYVDDERFDLTRVELLDYERVLDLAAGTLERRVTWRAGDDRRFSLRSQRLVSLEHRHLACVEYEVTALDGAARLTISSELALHADDSPPGSADPDAPGDSAPTS